MQYSISIAIPPASVQALNSANPPQFVTLSQQVNGTNSTAWISFAPEENNVVTWDSEYSVYQSTSMLQNGATINLGSSQSADLSMLYTYEDGVFESSSTGGSPTAFAVQNSGGNTYTFGLAQVATTPSGTTSLAPLNAVSIFNGESSTFTPEVVVSVYLSAYQNNGVVISEITSQAAVVTLTTATPDAQLGFNTSNNTFYQIS